MNCPFWNPRKVIAFWVQSNKACYPTNLHHTTDCAVTCNTSSFFKEMANKLVLQVTLQSVVIVTQNEGETSFLAMLGLQLMLQVIDYLKMISETKYLSLTQMIVLSLATQAHFSRRWQTSLCCKWHHNPLSLSPKMKVKQTCSKAWSAIDASSNWLLEDNIGNQISLPHTNDCAITCNTSLFFKELTKKLVLQATPRPLLVIISQQKGEMSLWRSRLVCKGCFKSAFWKPHSLAQRIVLSLATQACLPSPWQTRLSWR